MSQRNPMNERYTTDKNSGKTRRSAASAKPKTKAAASVSYTAPKKTTQERKAAIKEQRKADEAKQRELDRKYYKPDTERYKKLRLLWIVLLGAGVLCVVGSWLLREVEPAWIGTIFLVLAYLLIIGAFWVDFSKIRKERRSYQTKMLAKEIEESKKQKKAGNGAKDAGQNPDKDAGQNAGNDVDKNAAGQNATENVAKNSSEESDDAK